MRNLGLFFTACGVAALLYMILGMTGVVAIPRGDNVPFTDNGSPLIAVFSLMIGFALLMVYKGRKV